MPIILLFHLVIQVVRKHERKIEWICDLLPFSEVATMSSYVVTTPAGASLQITSFPPVVNTIKVVHVRLPKKEGDTLVLLRGFSFFAIKAPFIISCKRLLLFVVVECPWSDESYKRIVMPQISISFFGGVMLSFQRKKFPPSRGCSSSSN